MMTRPLSRIAGFSSFMEIGCDSGFRKIISNRRKAVMPAKSVGSSM